MIVSKIQQQTNFEARKPKHHFITDSMRSSIESLLNRMNSDAKRIQDGDHYKTTIITKLKLKNMIFEDERHLTRKLDFKEQMQGFSALRLGKKTRLDIDNSTGEIIDYKKPFLKPWFFVYKLAEKALGNMRCLYGLDEVKKEKLTINELTPEGQKKMKKFVLKTEEQRLKSLIKALSEDTSHEN